MPVNLSLICALMGRQAGLEPAPLRAITPCDIYCATERLMLRSHCRRLGEDLSRLDDARTKALTGHLVDALCGIAMEASIEGLSVIPHSIVKRCGLWNANV